MVPLRSAEKKANRVIQLASLVFYYSCAANMMQESGARFSTISSERGAKRKRLYAKSIRLDADAYEHEINSDVCRESE